MIDCVIAYLVALLFFCTFLEGTPRITIWQSQSGDTGLAFKEIAWNNPLFIGLVFGFTLVFL